MSSLRQLAARNQIVNWQSAPAEHEIAAYDKVKIEYRKYVEEYIRPLAQKSVRKKNFFTISTNVLCADIHTSKQNLDPIERDLYLPLEIAITKWSLSDGKKTIEERNLDSRVWMINPGPPVRNCVGYALDHRKLHKIQFDDGDNEFVQSDLNLVMKEINSFIAPDRVVFSLGLKYIRQDLGSLKWLNFQTGCKSKPIKIYSLEDLYVVLLRFFAPDLGACACQGLARHRLDYTSDVYQTKYQCDYHVVKSKTRDGECRNCAKGLSQAYSHVLIDDVVKFSA